MRRCRHDDVTCGKPQPRPRDAWKGAATCFSKSYLSISFIDVADHDRSVALTRSRDEGPRGSLPHSGAQAAMADAAGAAPGLQRGLVTGPLEALEDPVPPEVLLVRHVQ